MIGGLHGFKGISAWEVEAATGKDWVAWLAILDAWTGERKFVPITQYLIKHYELPYYWAQAVAVYYVWKRVYDLGLAGV